MQNGRNILTVGMLAVSLAASACVKQEEYRGYAVEFAKLDDVHTGSTKEQVMAALGSPSTTSTFGQEKWYYINMKMKQGALTSPELVGEDTITVTFNANGTVQSIDRSKGDSRRDIAFARDKTHSEGKSVTVMEQFLGNLGRFNTDKAATTAGKVHTPQPWQ